MSEEKYSFTFGAPSGYRHAPEEIGVEILQSNPELNELSRLEVYSCSVNVEWTDPRVAVVRFDVELIEDEPTADGEA